ncbi:hypothetical protein HPB51_024567 [Rhipicephalus microplus]|uniref:Ionotropic glutamate receptor C-terminal domain-containing protein n=1 Tax=Rhipicephalus microplus TaxID=6941 RepID=A0A9J6DJX4_RHIMP|nr:hypothetical protein HPB51_024567 [Rhipicephalus microplus]
MPYTTGRTRDGCAVTRLLSRLANATTLPGGVYFNDPSTQEARKDSTAYFAGKWLSCNAQRAEKPPAPLALESADPHLQRVWSTMEMSGPHAFFDSVSTAVVKVREEGFAVLMDSQTIEYLVAHDCSVLQLPGRLETGGFGFAMPHGSPLRHLFTNKILELQENGTLHALRQRWWFSTPDVDVGADRRCNPTADGSSSAAGSASGSRSGNKDVVGIRGLLLVLGIGCLVSLVVVIAECLWSLRCSSKRRNQVG